ncbi:hypothetical protein BDV23DRAFT_157779 [Aspergillus alliaceus]|nr:uncharacterized protein BDW43DRAFT_58706 [Aspergillus alliaceus]KAB8234268.1 hypothetical protein BDW43DRAFT_58706 [Aspergillus alliaceus]KAE8389041.1 hypothetical protein BDV23DRAFT_157779 [Aspergillus alliaceus]
MKSNDIDCRSNSSEVTLALNYSPNTAMTKVKDINPKPKDAGFASMETALMDIEVDMNTKHCDRLRAHVRNIEEENDTLRREIAVLQHLLSRCREQVEHST